jgi:hypothetical protein
MSANSIITMLLLILILLLVRSLFLFPVIKYGKQVLAERRCSRARGILPVMNLPVGSMRPITHDSFYSLHRKASYMLPLDFNVPEIENTVPEEDA